MDLQAPQAIAAYVAIAVPVTVAITNLSKIILEWLNQKQAVRKEVVQQTHEITTQYLNRALDPTVPLAIRHQLLRFLATPDKHGSRLSDWAKSELHRVEVVVEETDRAVVDAEKQLLAAKTNSEVAAAEKQLSLATSKKESLLKVPSPPPVTPANLRAGVIKERELSGLSMKGADLRGAEIDYRKLIGADFSGANVSAGSFQGCDLHGANLQLANLSSVSFYETDLRDANLASATLAGSRFPKARLEGANFEGTTLDKLDFTKATYNSKTKWPPGFEPVKHGAIQIDE